MDSLSNLSRCFPFGTVSENGSSFFSFLLEFVLVDTQCLCWFPVCSLSCCAETLGSAPSSENKAPDRSWLRTSHQKVVIGGSTFCGRILAIPFSLFVETGSGCVDDDKTAGDEAALEASVKLPHRKISGPASPQQRFCALYFSRASVSQLWRPNVCRRGQEGGEKIDA